ncbi:hypothetical protein QE152_g27206 [Popillia japonica]|uniref:Uncharacterized protein n=1 Tax=Popillia japonica TaxID=7064 RepID=A0AAW1JX35_POPJA
MEEIIKENETLKKEMVTMKEKMKKIELTLDICEKDKKKNNIIIKGLPIDTTDGNMLKSTMINFVNKEMAEEWKNNNVEVWKVGTWNIQSLKGKEVELAEEFEKTGLQIMGLTETKRKGNGNLTTSNGHLMLFSGVAETERAQAGVGIVIGV